MVFKGLLCAIAIILKSDSCGTIFCRGNSGGGIRRRHWSVRWTLISRPRVSGANALSSDPRVWIGGRILTQWRRTLWLHDQHGRDGQLRFQIEPLVFQVTWWESYVFSNFSCGLIWKTSYDELWNASCKLVSWNSIGPSAHGSTILLITENEFATRSEKNLESPHLCPSPQHQYRATRWTFMFLRVFCILSSKARKLKFKAHTSGPEYIHFPNESTPSRFSRCFRFFSFKIHQLKFKVRALSLRWLNLECEPWGSYTSTSAYFPLFLTFELQCTWVKS